MQVNTNLPIQTETNKYYNFTPSTAGYDIDFGESDKQFGWAGFAEDNGVVVITFNFNTAMEAGQKFILKKDSVFAFGVEDGSEYNGQTRYVLDKDCLTLLAASSDTIAAIIKDIPHYHASITTSPANGEKVSLLSGAVYDVASNYDYTKCLTKPYWGEDHYAPTLLKISWDCKEEANYYTLFLSTKKDLTDAESYVTYDTFAEVEDLYSGTDYYYQVVASYTNKTIKSQICHFETAALPRTIYIDGVTNTRDLGGYVTEDGKKRVRQGLIYRGGNADDITEAGAQKALYTYGIKTELDLRHTFEISENLLNKNGVTHLDVGENGAPSYVHPYNSISDPKNKEILAKEVRTFVEKDNYPIYVHCAIGRDRTGTICFLINALFGVSKKDFYLDYELSAMSTIGTDGENMPDALLSNYFTPMYEFIDGLSGESYADKVATFMKSYLDITDKEIQTIRDILLEEVK